MEGTVMFKGTYHATQTTGILGSSFQMTFSMLEHVHWKCYYCPTTSQTWKALLRMKSCIGSTDDPSYEFLPINTVTVDYYGRLSDILHLRLDQPNIRAFVCRALNNDNRTGTEKAAALKVPPQNIWARSWHDFCLHSCGFLGKKLVLHLYQNPLLVTQSKMALSAPLLKLWFQWRCRKKSRKQEWFVQYSSLPAVGHRAASDLPFHLSLPTLSAGV